MTSHFLLDHYYETICQQNEDNKDKCQSITKVSCEGKNTAECLYLKIESPFFMIFYQLWTFFSFLLSLNFIADRSFSNVNGRATSDQIEDLEDLVSTLLANLTSFETTIIG